MFATYMTKSSGHKYVKSFINNKKKANTPGKISKEACIRQFRLPTCIGKDVHSY